MSEPEYYYRLEDGAGLIYLRKFLVHSKTRCGVWLNIYPRQIKKRFVVNGARKQFACPTLEGAIESFRARKIKQLKILKHSVELIELALIKLNERDWYEEDNSWLLDDKITLSGRTK